MKALQLFLVSLYISLALPVMAQVDDVYFAPSANTTSTNVVQPNNNASSYTPASRAVPIQNTNANQQGNFYYSTQLRRFYQPTWGQSYWSNCYTNTYFYNNNPGWYGSNIHFNQPSVWNQPHFNGWGWNTWGWNQQPVMGFTSYNTWHNPYNAWNNPWNSPWNNPWNAGYYGHGWNTWNDPYGWHNPWMGMGGNRPLNNPQRPVFNGPRQGGTGYSGNTIPPANRPNKENPTNTQSSPANPNKEPGLFYEKPDEAVPQANPRQSTKPRTPVLERNEYERRPAAKPSRSTPTRAPRVTPSSGNKPAPRVNPSASPKPEPRVTPSRTSNPTPRVTRQPTTTPSRSYSRPTPSRSSGSRSSGGSRSSSPSRSGSSSSPSKGNR